METDWSKLLLVAFKLLNSWASNKQENIGERHKLNNIAFNVEQMIGYFDEVF